MKIILKSKYNHPKIVKLREGLYHAVFKCTTVTHKFFYRIYCR